MSDFLLILMFMLIARGPLSGVDTYGETYLTKHNTTCQMIDHLVFLCAMASYGQSRRQPFRSSTARMIAGVILALGILAGVFDAPQFVGGLFTKIGIPFVASKSQVLNSKFPYRLGLDLQGGTHLVYQADMSAVSSGDRASLAEALRDVIERRVNLFGIAEPVVQVDRSGDDWRLIVELAGVKDTNAAIGLIGETPFLEFREERSLQEREEIIHARERKERLDEDPYFSPTILTGRYLKRAELDFDPTTYEPLISLELTSEGAKIFADLTKRNINRPLAIYLDGAPISAPIVQQEIIGGRAQISGDFTPASARELAGRLNAGALPIPITLIVQQSVEASLGSESLATSIRAGLFGFLAVALFMIVWYRLPGLISVAALAIYIGFVLALLKGIHVTLTAAGIAGFVLSIGMAVDANVLIFERLKEEVRRGKTLDEALREGFSRAWTSIRDSNVSSLLTAGILYWFGTSMIKGFALTLGIGVIVSMATAISVTRTMLFAVMTQKVSRMRWFFLSGFS